MQEDTAAADKDVLAAVEELKALKIVVEGLEKEMEEITGIPRDKGAFRESVVSISHLQLYFLLKQSCYLSCSGCYSWAAYRQWL